MSTVYIAADHAGFLLKQELIPYIGTLGVAVEDMGAYILEATDDYPDLVTPCAKKVAAEAGSFGIVIGASGQGEAMAANRVPGVRAGVYYGGQSATQTDAAGEELDLIGSLRAHNDANMLSLGARFLTLEEAQEAVKSFLSTPFSGDPRHIRRLGKF